MAAIDVKNQTELGYLVESWMKNHDRRNLKMLSRLTGVPYTSLRRIIQKEVSPNLDQSLSILAFVADPQQRLEYLSEYFPESAKLLESALKTKSGVETDDASLEKYLDDPVYCELMELADAHSGLKRDYVKSVFGDRGLEKIAHLIDDEIIDEDLTTQIFRSTNRRKLRTITLTPLIKRIKSICDLFLQTRRAAVYFRCESLNEEAVGEIKKIMNETYAQVFRVIEDEKSRGTIPIGFAMLCGKYHEEKGQG